MTELVLRLHPVGPVLLCGFLTFPRARAGEVARAYRELMAGAPAEARRRAHAVRRPRAAPASWRSASTARSRTANAGSLRCARSARRSTRVAANPYRAFQAMTDTLHPFGMRAERRTRRVDALSDEVLDALLAAAEQPAAALSRLVLRPRGGLLEAMGGRPSASRCGLRSRASTGGNLAWLERVSIAVTDAGAAASVGLDAQVLPHR